MRHTPLGVITMVYKKTTTKNPRHKYFLVKSTHEHSHSVAYALDMSFSHFQLGPMQFEYPLTLN